MCGQLNLTLLPIEVGSLSVAVSSRTKTLPSPTEVFQYFTYEGPEANILAILKTALLCFSNLFYAKSNNTKQGKYNIRK